VEFAVWTDSLGTDEGGKNLVIPPTPYVVQHRRSFEDIDLSSYDIIIESGDFYLSLIQPEHWNYGIGMDVNGVSASRTWIGSGSSWKKYEAYGIERNAVIRAIVIYREDLPSHVAAEIMSLPKGHRLYQNFPNPFNPTTQITFSLAKREFVHLEILDVLGQSVKTLSYREYSAGDHILAWNGRNQLGNNVPSGIYLYRLIAKNHFQTKKMLLLR
jgi:hypothetical protein